MTSESTPQNELAQLLKAHNHRIVLAESCTAGLISAQLGSVPGVSEVLAGSAVVYQLATKIRWLDVTAESLQTFGPVSEPVSEQMAVGVLAKTPHATVAASVTGHLGPNAPPDLDGVAWSTVAVRDGNDTRIYSRQLRLSDADRQPDDAVTVSTRQARQQLAARLVMRFCLDVLTGNGTDRDA